MAGIKVNYETIMIFSTQSGEENVKALYEKFKTLITENGSIDVEEDWGKRRLAYPINDELEGYYYLVRFNSGADFPAELDRVYKITDGVLRTIIIKLDDEIVAAAKAKAEAEVKAKAEAELKAKTDAENKAKAEAEAKKAEAEVKTEAVPEAVAEAAADNGTQE